VDVLILTLFVSLILAGAGVGLFIWSVRQGTHEHAERLALLPIEDDDPPEDPEEP
jgi:cbb3-type cytochrome oxidase maturation protein